jgi:hypothetical protein
MVEQDYLPCRAVAAISEYEFLSKQASYGNSESG